MKKEHAELLLKKAQDEFYEHNKSLVSRCETLEEKTHAFDLARQNMLESRDTIVSIINELKEKSKLVIDQKDGIGALFHLVCDVLQRCKNEVVEVAHGTDNNGIMQLTDVVTKSHEDIVSFAEMVTQFGIFVDKNTEATQALRATFEGPDETASRRWKHCEEGATYLVELSNRLRRLELSGIVRQGLSVFDRQSSSTSLISSAESSDLEAEISANV